jgi:hypothetical protein
MTVQMTFNSINESKMHPRNTQMRNEWEQTQQSQQKSKGKPRNQNQECQVLWKYIAE